MGRRIIDLSVPLRNYDTEPNIQEITYINHQEMARQRAMAWNLPAGEFPTPNVFLASEIVRAASHAGTHVDAPYHYGPTCEGKPAATIDQIRLEWCFSDAFVLDFSHYETGQIIDDKAIDAALKKIGYEIKPYDIALIRTDTTTRYLNVPRFDLLHPGLNREAVLYLTDRGVKVIGIDAWGLDIPIPMMIERYKKGDKNAFYPAHMAGRDVEYYQIEKLINLDQLPPYGFKVACFPVKIERASGAWCRAVAIIED